MLRLHTGRDAQGAKAYFEQGLSREDYYAEGLEVTGHWFGRGAEHLGLSGPVDRDDFHALCENRHPQSGERLTARTKATAGSASTSHSAFRSQSRSTMR